MNNQDLATRLLMAVATAVAGGYLTTIIPAANPQTQRLLQAGVTVATLGCMARIFGVL